MTCDCEEPDAFRQVMRTARVEHRCCECYATIGPGDPYEYSSGVWDSRGDSFKTWDLCAEMRGFFGDKLTEAGDCGPPFCGLVAWIRESGTMNWRDVRSWQPIARLVTDDRSARVVGRAMGLLYAHDIREYDIHEVRTAARRRGQVLTVEQAEEVVGW
jgi:hypothetical protein